MGLLKDQSNYLLGVFPCHKAFGIISLDDFVAWWQRRTVDSLQLLIVLGITADGHGDCLMDGGGCWAYSFVARLNHMTI